MVVLDHDLGSDQTHELDEGVHVAESEVPQWAVLGVVLVSDVETECCLGKSQRIKPAEK